VRSLFCGGTAALVFLSFSVCVLPRRSDDTTYAFTFDFHASVVPEESVWKVHGRNVLMHLKKAEVSDEHWPRLTKEKQFDKQYVATDWSRYVDEDDEDDDAGFDVGDLDGAANFGGGGYDGGGYEVDDEPDSDDDVDLTDLDFPPAGGEGVAEEPPQGEDDEATVAPPPVSASDPPVAEEPAATATSTDADETPAPATET